MTVKEANQKIEAIENDVKQIQKFLNLSSEDRRKIEEELELNITIEGLVNMAVNCMLSWKITLKDKVDNTEVK